MLQREESTVVGAALARLSPAEREVLLAHEVDGAGTAELAASRESSPGAIAAQLNRTRAKLRVEYLLADTAVTPPTDRCRPVLFALSAGDRRRQRELDTAGHLLDCDCCLALSTALFDRRPPAAERRRGQGDGHRGRRCGDRPTAGPGHRGQGRVHAPPISP